MRGSRRLPAISDAYLNAAIVIFEAAHVAARLACLSLEDSTNRQRAWLCRDTGTRPGPCYSGASLKLASPGVSGRACV